jgi:hypothetical protein
MIAAAPVPTVVAALRAKALPRKTTQPITSGVPFVGAVSDTGFVFDHFIPGWRNLSVLYGRFENTDAGTVVCVRVQPSPIAIALLCLWFASFAVFIGAGVQIRAESGPGLMIASIAAIVLAIIGVRWAVWYEANKAMKILQRALRHLPEEPESPDNARSHTG